MTKKTLYLATPYGFSKQWKEKLLPELVETIEALGAEVWEPFCRNGQVDKFNSGWAHKIAVADLNDIKNADGIFAGLPRSGWKDFFYTSIQEISCPEKALAIWLKP